MKEPSGPSFAGVAGEEELPAHTRWQRTSPFALWFFLAGAVKGMFAGAGQIAASLGALLALGSQGLAAFAGGAIGLLAVVAVTATLRYIFFRYSLQPDRLRIRQGVFKKTELNVQFERIQGVTVEQSLIFRMLGLVTVGFDTAGSAAQEGQLPAVSPSFASALRARIERERKARQVASAAPDAAPNTLAEERSERLVRLGNGDMVRIGLADRSVLAGLALAPVVGQFIDENIREWSETQLRHMAAEFQELSLLAGGSVVAGALALLLVLALIVTIASAFLRYHDFTLFAASTGDGTMRFRSVRGLFTRRETVVMRAKIQQLRLSQSLLFRWFRRFHLRALPAGGSPTASAEHAASADDTLHVPALATEAVRPLAAKVFAEEGERLSLLPAEDAFERISPAYIVVRLRVVGIAPALLALAALYPFFGPISFWCLAWAPLTGLVAWQKWRRHAYMHTDDGLAVRSGLLGFKVDACLLRKVQAVALRQSPLQRRKGLATLEVALASGGVTLLYIPYANACRLRDYMLYKVESSRGPWH